MMTEENRPVTVTCNNKIYIAKMMTEENRPVTCNNKYI